jgi:hypothetical protein
VAFEISISESAASEIEALRAYDQKRIATAIREQLTHQLMVPTRNRKCLVGLAPDFEHVMPVWELRVVCFACFMM